MIHIDRLALNLPAGFEARAADIVRRVGLELAVLPVAGQTNVARLTVDGLSITASMSNAQIARQIAGGLRNALASATRTGRTESFRSRTQPEPFR